MFNASLILVSSVIFVSFVIFTHDRSEEVFDLVSIHMWRHKLRVLLAGTVTLLRWLLLELLHDTILITWLEIGTYARAIDLRTFEHVFFSG